MSHVPDQVRIKLRFDTIADYEHNAIEIDF